MKVVSLDCPNCGSSLPLENLNLDRDYLFCAYCGKKIYLDDESIKLTFKKIDVAKIKEVESKERIRMEELELKRVREKNKEDRTNSIHKLSIKLLLFGIVLAVLGFFFVSLLGENYDGPLYIVPMLGAIIASYSLLVLITNEQD